MTLQQVVIFGHVVLAFVGLVVATFMAERK